MYLAWWFIFSPSSSVGKGHGSEFTSQ